MAKNENKIYDVGIYCRLSKDDGTDGESVSIDTQKAILTKYVQDREWNIYNIYVDDGYSGTNFERPGFQKMIKDIENGLVNCVVTKDLSRLGRNYLESGFYLEVFFPEHNVRYIAVNDNVDTNRETSMDISPFKNILNEMYASDISMKVKTAHRARFNQGKFMGSHAPYGYKKDPQDHNHLIIDEATAPVVRKIFDLALEGKGVGVIRHYLISHRILRPSAYAAIQGEPGYERYFENNEENRFNWCENGVRQILRSAVYAGSLVGYKRIKPNMKCKKKLSRLPEDWEVVPNTHEGIVSQEEFDLVQNLMTSRRRQTADTKFDNIFAGILKCADCGYGMRASSANRRKRPEILDCIQYSCNNYGRYGNKHCTAHSIEARDLFNAVTADINYFAKLALKDEKAVRTIEKKLTETDKNKVTAFEREQRKINKRLTELDRLFSSLYEDKVMENITQHNFEMMSEKYQEEQSTLEARLQEITQVIEESKKQEQDVHDFISLIQNYQGIRKLDAATVNALIDKITVSEKVKHEDGTITQEIKIYYKFIGSIDELQIVPTKRWTALPPRKCDLCGAEYTPGSAISRYCPQCAVKVHREQSNESKRRSRAKAKNNVA